MRCVHNCLARVVTKYRRFCSALLCDKEYVIIAIRKVVPLKYRCADDRLRKELMRNCLINAFYFILFYNDRFPSHWNNALTWGFKRQSSKVNLSFE